MGVMDIKVSRTRKIALIKKTFTNFIKKQPEYQWTNALSSRVYQNAFIAFNNSLERFFVSAELGYHTSKNTRGESKMISGILMWNWNISKF